MLQSAVAGVQPPSLCLESGDRHGSVFLVALWGLMQFITGLRVGDRLFLGGPRRRPSRKAGGGRSPPPLWTNIPVFSIWVVGGDKLAFGITSQTGYPGDPPPSPPQTPKMADLRPLKQVMHFISPQRAAMYKPLQPRRPIEFSGGPAAAPGIDLSYGLDRLGRPVGRRAVARWPTGPSWL